MKKIVSVMGALSALALVASPAMANNSASGGFVVGGVAGSYNSNTNASFEVKGKTDGASASGFQTNLDLKNSSVAAFGSFGAAGSATMVTPYSVDTNSQHVGAFGGFTKGDAKLNGSAQTFAQSNGESSFKANASQFENTNVNFGVLGAFGSFDN